MRVLFSKKLIFISKPRCGSTSVRRLLNKYINPELNDFAVDMAGQKPAYHPHITAPCLINQLSAEFNTDLSDFKIFTITRNPLEMLMSYYRFFKPDVNGRYNYQIGHVDKIESFNKWLLTGRIGMAPDWQKNAPDFVNQNDFSPLSLEAHICNKSNQNCVTDFFRIEDSASITNWLSEILSDKISLPRVNKSDLEQDLIITDEARCRIRKCFPMEQQLYSL